MNHLSIHIEGGLLSPDFLEAIHEAPGQKPADFNLKARDSIVDEVSAIWGDILTYWQAFQRRMARTESLQSESLTTITREQWLLPLLEALGYTLTYQRSATEVAGRTYRISHRAGADDSAPPVHIVAYDQELGDRPPTGRNALSPHALVQDYLNRTDEHLWGLVSNGRILRLLRDSTYFTRPAYIEFDLEQMILNERLDEFILLYRLAHRTRLPQPGAAPADSLLEQYHQAAIEQGGRIRDGLRQAVADAILTFGQGFLRHPRNDKLRQRLTSGKLTAEGYYQQLLYLIYRLLFLMVAEERNLLALPEAGSATPYYRHYLSLSRLRELADAHLSAPQRFNDLYLGLRTLFYALHDEKLAAQLGVPALNGELFSVNNAPDLDEAYLDNRELLKAIRYLSYFTPPDEQVRRRVNYAALDVEELGSVYESLLDEQPVVSGLSQDGSSPAAPPAPLSFSFVSGTARKTTGSYYTPRELVNEVIKSALVPVIRQRLASAGNDPDAQKAALLSLRVCDPACGSGHFLLAAARRIGYELARVQTGGGEPAPDAVRAATREAITHCIYGVDKNPLAVDLCKVALWIEGHNQGKPLTFLDYRIRCGDSLVGVLDMAVLEEGIPDSAFTPVTGDNKSIASSLRKQNKQEREGRQDTMFDIIYADGILQTDEAAWQAFEEMPEDTPAQVNAKQERYAALREQLEPARTAANLWTAAFFSELTADNLPNVPTTSVLRRHLTGQALSKQIVGAATALAQANRFFHWPLEFPRVFEDRPGGPAPGFDVVLGNPPWEQVQFDDREFFASRAPEIANALNMAVRKKMLTQLQKDKPRLYASYEAAVRQLDNVKHFIHASDRFPLTSYGRLNLAPLFAELSRHIVAGSGRVGIILPTGIATDSFNQYFFRDLVDSAALVSLYDFENRKAIFPGVHRSYKFCLLTLRGTGSRTEEGEAAEFIFFAHEVADLRDEERRFTLSAADIALLNPNTRTCPIFRSKRDAELTKSIYRRVPVLIKEGTEEENPWGIRFMLMFMMNTDSYRFRTRQQLEAEGWQLRQNRFVRDGAVYLPLYEAKMLHQFDHRWATYEDLQTRDMTPAEKNDPTRLVLPRYWVSEEEVNGRLGNSPGWLIGFRDVTNTTNERTAIFSILEKTAVGHTAPLIFLQTLAANDGGILVGSIDSFVFDYATRQKVGGTHLTYSYLKQLPVLPPQTYHHPYPWLPAPSHTLHHFLLSRVLELTYTAYDLRPFAQDCGYHGPPFRWDEAQPETVGRRFLLRCELDAAYFHLYGIQRDDVAYIMDTFPIVRRKDEAAHGEYRTKRVILEIYDAMTTAMQTGRPYRTPLDPPPADPAAAHPWDTTYLGPPLPREQWWQRKDKGERTSYQGEAAPTVLREPGPTLEPRQPPAGHHNFTPPSGGYSQRLKRVMDLGQPRDPAELAELVAALTDQESNIRWLAGSALARLGSLAVVEMLAAFLRTHPGETATQEAQRVLGLIGQTAGEEGVRTAVRRVLQPGS